LLSKLIFQLEFLWPKILTDSPNWENEKFKKVFVLKGEVPNMRLFISKKTFYCSFKYCIWQTNWKKCKDLFGTENTSYNSVFIIASKYISLWKSYCRYYAYYEDVEAANWFNIHEPLFCSRNCRSNLHFRLGYLCGNNWDNKRNIWVNLCQSVLYRISDKWMCVLAKSTLDTPKKCVNIRIVRTDKASDVYI